LAVSAGCVLFLLIVANYDFQVQTVNIIRQEGSLTEYFLMQLLIFNFIGFLNILPIGKSDGANLLATLRAAELNPLQYSIQHFDEATNLGLTPEQIGPHCLEAALIVNEISTLKAEAEFRLFLVHLESMNTKGQATSYINFMKHAHLLEPNRMKELVGLYQRMKQELGETGLSFDFKTKSKPDGESEIEPPDPVNNLTPQSKLVLTLAREQAGRFNHKFLGTEHLLLGLIKIGQGAAANVLKKMGLDLETVRLEVEKQVGTGLNKKQLGNIITPRVKKVLNLAAKEAKQLQHAYVGTEHILLGLLREGDGVAARVLKNLDVDLKETRKEIIRELFLNRATDDDDADDLGLIKEGEKDSEEAKGVTESASRRTDTPTETSRQKAVESKFCHECGQSAQPSDKFCAKCGSCLRKA
jgi:hypothetical protein